MNPHAGLRCHLHMASLEAICMSLTGHKGEFVFNCSDNIAQFELLALAVPLRAGALDVFNNEKVKN
jgi:hypothetical protein